MFSLTPIEQWAVKLYVRAVTTGIAQDQELLRLRSEVSRLRNFVDQLRLERRRFLENLEEID